MIRFREITPEDDAALALIIRENLKKYGLDIPGTAYFDDSLSSLSSYYLQDPEKRFYFVADEGGTRIPQRSEKQRKRCDSIPIVFQGTARRLGRETPPR